MHPDVKKRFDDINARIDRIRRRLQEIADLEARDALTGGPAARGILDPERSRLIERTEELLDEADRLLSGRIDKHATLAAYGLRLDFTSVTGDARYLIPFSDVREVHVAAPAGDTLTRAIIALAEGIGPIKLSAPGWNCANVPVGVDNAPLIPKGGQVVLTRPEGDTST